ncbi:MAG: hypothetical protein AAF196_15570 [Planctomycetota bacterium]
MENRQWDAKASFVAGAVLVGALSLAVAFLVWPDHEPALKPRRSVAEREPDGSSEEPVRVVASPRVESVDSDLGSSSGATSRASDDDIDGRELEWFDDKLAAVDVSDEAMTRRAERQHVWEDRTQFRGCFGFPLSELDPTKFDAVKDAIVGYAPLIAQAGVERDRSIWRSIREVWTRGQAIPMTSTTPPERPAGALSRVVVSSPELGGGYAFLLDRSNAPDLAARHDELKQLLSQRRALVRQIAGR